MNDRYIGSDGATVRVLGNALLVRPDPEPTKTDGGIIFQNAGSLFHSGEVLAVGFVTTDAADFQTPVPGVEVGDHVLYVKFLELSSTNPQIKRILGDDVVHLRPSDVLLVFDAEDVPRVR